jgi:large subunit ribosomal protein L30e
MEIDMSKVLRSALSTGKVVVGIKQTREAVKNGTAQVVIVSSDCVEQSLKELKGIPLMKYPGMGVDLGVACGKPFPISALAVLESGDSEILSFGSMNE